MSAFIDERREDFGVELICQTLGVSASAYYQRAKSERSARDLEDERLLGVIRATHKANYEAYGSRRGRRGFAGRALAGARARGRRAGRAARA